MNAIRKILMPLLIIPFGMFMYVFTHPDWQEESSGFELLFMGIGIPILIGNFIAWFYPEIVKAYFPVKEDWGAGGDKLIALAVMISTLIAFLCVGAGIVSTLTNVRARPIFKSSTLQPGMGTALAHSRELESTIDSLSESDVTPMHQLPGTRLPPGSAFQVPETDIPTEQTPQIPVSGGEASSPSALSAARTPASIPTLGTVAPAGLCTRARQDYMDALLESVQEADAEYRVGVVWSVQSNQEANLWFVAAKISGPDINTGTPPGVWALLVDLAGNINLYAINDSATQYSSADLGTDREPALTMQSAGAQSAYNCAVQTS